jgi:hypothetical protein
LALGTAITRLPGTGGAVAGTLASATPSFTSPSTIGTGGTFNAAAAATYEAQRLSPGGDPSNLYNFQEFVWLTPETLRTGINTTFRYDLTTNTSLYLETAFQQNKSHIELAPSPISTAGDNNLLLPKASDTSNCGIQLRTTAEWGAALRLIMSVDSVIKLTIKRILVITEIKFVCHDLISLIQRREKKNTCKNDKQTNFWSFGNNVSSLK